MKTSVTGTSSIKTDENRLTGCFFSDVVFNLISSALSDNGIKTLEKGYNFAPIQRITNESELTTDLGNSAVV